MILNIYKPKGWTSFDVVARLRNQLNIKKIGHAGTLDPLAEGVLIVLTESDTKKQDDFMHQPKEYLAKIAFGIDSPTYDLEGPVTQTSQYPSQEVVLANLPKFIGEIEQRVPAYSAVKVSGKRLYNLARSQSVTEAELPIKKVTIYSIEVVSFENTSVVFDGQTVTLPVLTCVVACGSGTYIRSLAHDMGGVLVSLIRTRVGDFTVQESSRILC